ncbi:MAG: hypothetical protein HOW73_15220 [Polyangiaceae bacterium]|nr:hypothetical protein [Polyangiaceae bacterium]
MADVARHLHLIASVVLLLSSGCGDSAATSNGGAGGSGAGGAASTNTGGGSSSSTGGSDLGGEGGTGGAAEPPDPCLDATPECPAHTGLAEGGGLRTIDRCAYPLNDKGTWEDKGAIVDALAAKLSIATIDDIAQDLNRVGTPASDVVGNVSTIARAFSFSDSDNATGEWWPQGITGTWDATAEGTLGGKKLALVSWYHGGGPGTPSTDVRLSLVDVTGNTYPYRLLLLVEPTGTPEAPDFVSVPLHSGGVAWVGRYLYIVDTWNGFRVFDMERILRPDIGEADQMGYDPASDSYYAQNFKYIVPQIGHYEDPNLCNQRFSFVSIDRSTDPVSVVTGEYDPDSVYGGIFRYPVDETGLLKGGPTLFPAEAWVCGQKALQGVVANEGQFWMSSSAPDGWDGELYRAAPDSPSETYGWNKWPEDLSYEPADDLLWSVSEGENERFVFATPLSAVSQ